MVKGKCSASVKFSTYDAPLLHVRAAALEDLIYIKIGGKNYTHQEIGMNELNKARQRLLNGSLMVAWRLVPCNG